MAVENDGDNDWKNVAFAILQLIGGRDRQPLHSFSRPIMTTQIATKPKVSP